MSYGATAIPMGRAQQIATKLNLKHNSNKSYVHCDFSKCFIDYLKNANEFRLFVDNKYLQHDITFICISIVVDSLFFVHLYMAREGIEKSFRSTLNTTRAL